MKWEKILEKLRLADIKKNIKADQAGNINLKIENNTYNYTNVDPDALSKFLDSQIDEKIETAIKKKTFERLKSIDSTLKWLSDSTITNITSGATLSTAIDFVTDPLGKKPSDNE